MEKFGMRKGFRAKKAIGIAIMAVAAITLLGFVVMGLWNSVLAVVLPVKIITFWQALGIFVLSKILFGGFKKGFGGHRRHEWNEKMKEKWENMNPEEKEAFKKEWRNKCRNWRMFREPIHEQGPDA